MKQTSGTNLHFFSVYSDIGAGKHGTIEGVQLLRDRMHKLYPDAAFSDIRPSYSSADYAYPHAKYIEHLTPFFEQTLLPALQQGLLHCSQCGDFPIIISGDHSGAIGNVAAFLNHHRDKKTAIVWIDAHADLHSVYTTPSGNLHGMPLGAILRLDNLANQINDLDATAADYWARLKSLTVQPLPASNVYFLGLRSFEAPEAALLECHNIYHRSAIAHRAQFQCELAALKKTLAAYEAIYISFDIDALDADLVPATGTPVTDGYTKQELEAILAALLSLPNVQAFEIVEFNPLLDSDSQKYETVFDLLQQATMLIQATRLPASEHKSA